MHPLFVDGLDEISANIANVGDGQLRPHARQDLPDPQQRHMDG